MKAAFATLVVGSTLAVCASGELPVAEKQVTARDAQQTEECQIGRMVKQIQEAIRAPENEASLATIVKYGTDSRYYVMIRGWLKEELLGVESQRDAAREETTKAVFGKKVEFLRKAIRRIDLE